MDVQLCGCTPDSQSIVYLKCWKSKEDFSWRSLIPPPDIDRQDTVQPKDGKIHCSIPTWPLVLAPDWWTLTYQKPEGLALWNGWRGQAFSAHTEIGAQAGQVPQPSLWSDFQVSWKLWQGTSLFSWTLMKLSEGAKARWWSGKVKMEHSGISADISIFIGTSNQFVPHSCFIRICTKAPLLKIVKITNSIAPPAPLTWNSKLTFTKLKKFKQGLKCVCVRACICVFERQYANDWIVRPSRAVHSALLPGLVDYRPPVFNGRPNRITKIQRNQ